MQAVVDQELWEAVNGLKPVDVPADMTREQAIAALAVIRDFFRTGAESAQANGSLAFRDWREQRAQHAETQICWLEQKDDHAPRRHHR